MASKAKSLQALYEKYNSDRLIIIFSNPTIELWYKLHFTYSTRTYQNGQEVIADLKSYIPNYNKNVDCFSYLEPRTWEAVKNSEKLLEFYSKTTQPYLICRGIFSLIVGRKKSPTSKVGDEFRRTQKDKIPKYDKTS